MSERNAIGREWHDKERYGNMKTIEVIVQCGAVSGKVHRAQKVKDLEWHVNEFMTYLHKSAQEIMVNKGVNLIHVQMDLFAT